MVITSTQTETEVDFVCQVRRALERVFTLRSSQAGNQFTANVECIPGFKKSFRNIQCRPIHAFLESSFAGYLLSILAIYLSCSGYNSVAEILEFGTISFSRYRFTCLACANPASGIVKVGLMSDGCPMENLNSSEMWSDSSLILTFPKPIRSNGWYIDLKVGTKATPAKFKFEASNDGRQWVVVGASSRSLRRLDRWELFFQPDIAFNHDVYLRTLQSCSEFTLLAQSSSQCYNKEPGRLTFNHEWFWPMLYPAVIDFAGALITLIMVMMNFSGHFKYAPSVLLFSTVGFSCIFLATSISFCVTPDFDGNMAWEQSIYPMTMAWALGITAVIAALLGQERYVPDHLVLLGVQYEFCRVLNVVIQIGSSTTVLHIGTASIAPISIIAVGCALKLHAYFHLRRSRKSFAAFAQDIDKVMADVLSTADNDALEDLRHRLSQCAKHIEPYQFSRLATFDGAEGLNPAFTAKLKRTQFVMHSGDNVLQETRSFRLAQQELAGPGHGRARVACLDQLIARGIAAGPFLRFKVEQWAGATGGYLHSVEGGYIPGMDVLRDRRLASRVRWQDVKPARRIAEAYMCTLGREAWRLTDVTRQRIVFDSLASLRGGLATIMADDDVVVHGVADSLRVEGPSVAVPAYHRCVTVYVTVMTQDTVRLGVEAHVCEVQLALRALADLDTPPAHAAFVDLKDAHACVHTSYLLDIARHLLPVALKGASPALGMAGLDRRLSHPATTKHSPSAIDCMDKAAAQADTSSGVREAGRVPPLPRVTEALAEWLLDTCLRVASLPGDTLSSELKYSYAVMARASFSSGPYTSTPITCIMSKPLFQCMVFGMGVNSFVDAYRAIGAAAAAGAMDYTHYRFTSLPPPGGPPINASWPGLAALGLLFHGCRVHTAAPAAVADAAAATMGAAGCLGSVGFGGTCSARGGEPSVVMSLKAPVIATGWFFQSHPGVPDPARFTLEGSHNAESWNLVGASTVAFRENGRASFILDPWPWGESPQQVLDGVGRAFDMLPPAAWLGSWLAPHLLSLVQWWLMVAVSVAGRSVWARPVAAVVLGLHGGSVLIFGVVHAAAGDLSAAAACALRSLPFFHLAALFVRDDLFAMLLWTVGVSHIATELATMAFCEGYSMEELPQSLGKASSFAKGLIAFTFGLVFCLGRWYFVSRAEALILGDRLTYDKVWLRLTRPAAQRGPTPAEPGPAENRAALEELAIIARPYERLTLPQQMSISAATESCWGCGPIEEGVGGAQSGLYDSVTASAQYSSESGAAALQLQGGGMPVRCLDQLFTQAAGLDPIIRRLCIKWASASRGCFLCHPTDARGRLGRAENTLVYRRWEDLDNDPRGAEAAVRWAKLKKPLRAMEKVTRNYRQDVSFLVDVCRQALILETVADMSTCLRALVDDPDVKVLRIKNRMELTAADYAPDDTPLGTGAAGDNVTGYRDVSINLTVRSEEARRFGLDGHVCEVQLLLIDIARVKKDSGHARYVQWRNTRGE